MPVYLLFDCREIITLDVAKFSAGNLARRGQPLYDSASDFLGLNFADIYHIGPFADDEKDRIINARHAEVVFPKQLSLFYLKHICCRSKAEYDSLRNLLSNVNWNKWKSKVHSRNPHSLFNLEWLHVTSVTLKREQIIFELHRPSRADDHGPFNIRVDIDDAWSQGSFPL